MVTGDSERQINMNFYQIGDPLHLQDSDHPDISLVSTQLSGRNLNAWSRSIRIALREK